MSDDRPSIGKVYEAINGVRLDVAVIKNQMVDLADHEHRIRALERRVWISIGGFGLIAAAAPYLNTLIQ